jgi:preprotein translocase subunit Sss1
MQPCTQSEKIAKMEERLTVMVESVEKLATAVSGLVKFEVEMKAIEKFEMKKTGNNYKLIAALIGVGSFSVGLIGLVITLIYMK